MRALLLAAGKATRLGSLSNTTPKCLHDVGGELLLDRVVRQLYEAGVEEFLINTHHLAEQIVAHIDNRPDRARFTTVFEPELLGTLGTLRANAGYFGSDAGWVLHADNFIGGSLLGLRHGFETRPADSWGTVLTFEAQDPTSCGVVMTDERGVVTGFFEKVPEPPSRQASAATFIFGPAALEVAAALPSADTDISRDLIPHLVGHLNAVDHDRGVIDIGTPQGLSDARAAADQSS